jgi:chromosome partitioning protein
LNLTCALARRGWKSLLVDTDPQGAVGLSIKGAESRGKGGLVACLAGELAVSEAAVSTTLPELALLPIAGNGGEPPGSRPSGLWEALADREAVGRILEQARAGYEVVVVDTPSGLSGATRSVLECADYLLVPLQAEPLALRAIPQILTAVAEVRAGGAPLQMAGFILTMLNSASDVSLSVAQESWGSLPTDLVLSSFVPRDPAFLKASALGVPLYLLSRRPPAVASVFDQTAAELEPRLGLSREDEDDEPLSLLD